jgi:hypothetical protein
MLSIKWECPGKPVFVLEVRSEGDEWRPFNKVWLLFIQVLAMCSKLH